MKPQTLGRNYNVDKNVPVQCVKCDLLNDLDIKDSCFLLMLIYEGNAYFEVGETSFEVIGPCFVCFDETNSPKLVRERGLKCDSIYFHPTFLNINLTFSRIHNINFESLALVHDMFLLKPFTDKVNYMYPIFDEQMDNIKRLFSKMENELNNQSDWYWSCRTRSYFMEMMLLLERICSFVGKNNAIETAAQIQNSHLKKAVIYIESNYHNSVSLDSIVKSVSLNHSTLTQLFKDELNMTPIGYLWFHRLKVAKKFLEFTDLPIKDIALQCGFKTTQHFSRKFEEMLGSTPGVFRTNAVAKRKKSFIQFNGE